jgi:hypothetical protein
MVSVAAATQLVACGTAPGDAGEPMATNQLEVTGTLLHEEQVGAVRIGWWDTPSGLIGIAQGPVDHPEFSRRVVESIRQPTLGEAFRALHAVTGGSMDLPAALAAADARHPVAPSDQGLATASGAERVPAPPPSGGSAGAARARSGDLEVVSSALTPADDDAQVRTWLCVNAQTCQVGYGSIFSGWIQNTMGYRVQLFNSSYDAPAAYGSRYQVGDYHSWVMSFSGQMQPRYIVDVTYYGGVGQFRRESWISGWQPFPISDSNGSVTFDQSKPLGPNLRVSMAQAWSAPDLKGFVGGTPQLHNFCVVDVPTAFTSLPFHPSGKLRYRSEGGVKLQPFNARLAPFASESDFLGLTCPDISATWSNHVQSVGRLHTTNNDNRWFVMSRALPGSVGGAGLFLAQFADTSLGNPDGRLIPAGASYTGEPPDNRRTWYYYPIPDTDHPGGLQVVGGIVAIANEGVGSSPGSVNFYDFRAPGSTTAWFQRLWLDGNNGEPGVPSANSKPTAAGLAKLASGLYVLFVLNKDDQYSGRFYMSNSGTLDGNTRWQWMSDVKWSGHKYQNANFITDCNGTLYLAMTNNENYNGYCDFSGCVLDAGQNTADLYKVAVQSGTSNVQLTLSRSMQFGIDDDGYDQFRAAADFYVGRDNKLLLYSHAHHANTNAVGCPDSKLKLSEFAY